MHSGCKIANFMRYGQIFISKLCAVTVIFNTFALSDGFIRRQACLCCIVDVAFGGKLPDLIYTIN